MPRRRYRKQVAYFAPGNLRKWDFTSETDHDECLRRSRAEFGGQRKSKHQKPATPITPAMLIAAREAADAAEARGERVWAERLRLEDLSEGEREAEKLKQNGMLFAT